MPNDWVDGAAGGQRVPRWARNDKVRFHDRVIFGLGMMELFSGSE
jgi:hypothetical protein